MRHVSMKAQAFQPVMQEVSEEGEDLYTQVAGIMFGAIVNEFQTSKSPELTAKTSFDYADAFMRERYGRMCVKAAGVDLQCLERHLQDTSLKPL